MSAFITLHRDLPREGPGLPEDVAWAASVVGLRPDAVICDAACGPGADFAALLKAAPQGHVTGIDKMAHFVQAAQDAHAGDTRVSVKQGDMAQFDGQFDMIWCAGALYFLGLSAGLRGWRQNLRKGGVIAFSMPCYFTAKPSQAAQAFWEGESEVFTQPAMATQIALAGYTLLGARALSDAAWEAYYQPMAARINDLEPSADADLKAVLQAGRDEFANWRAVKSETGYLLCVVRPT